MHEVGRLIKEYLTRGRMMQVATAASGKPWVCTVYYVEDKELRLYWLSLPTRRHSQAIAQNNHIAIAVPVKFDKPVIGLQAEGVATVVEDAGRIASVMHAYVERYNSGKQFYDNFIAGKNQHLLYSFTPELFVLFDEVTFPEQGRREWIPAKLS